MAGRPRRRSAAPLPNPYALDEPAAGPSTWVPAALVTATTAGLVLAGAGMAAAAPGEDDVDPGFGSSDFDTSSTPDPGPSEPAVPDPVVPDLDLPDLDGGELGISDVELELPAPSDPGAPPSTPGGEAEPFTTGQDDGIVYGIDEGTSLRPFAPVDTASDTPDPSLPATDPADATTPTPAEQATDAGPDATTGASHPTGSAGPPAPDGTEPVGTSGPPPVVPGTADDEVLPTDPAEDGSTAADEATHDATAPSGATGASPEPTEPVGPTVETSVEPTGRTEPTEAATGPTGTPVEPTDVAAGSGPDEPTRPDAARPPDAVTPPADTAPPTESGDDLTEDERIRDFWRAANNLEPLGSSRRAAGVGPEADPPGPGTGPAADDSVAAYFMALNSYDPPGGWGAPTDPDKIRYQWRVGTDGVGDFVRVPDFDPGSGEPGVMIEPGATGPAFSVYSRPGALGTPWLDVDAGSIPPEGSERRSVLGGEHSPLPIPRTGHPYTTPELAEFRRQTNLRQLAGLGTFTAPAQDGQPLRFAVDLPWVEDVPGVLLPPQPGEATLTCHVGDACFTFNDVGNLAVTRTRTGPDGRPVTTQEYRATTPPRELPDALPTPPVSWVFEPGADGGSGSFTAFPGIGDSTDPASTVLQVFRDREGRVVRAQVAGGSGADDPEELRRPDTRRPGDATPRDPRSWRVSSSDRARHPFRDATGPGWSLFVRSDGTSGQERLSGSVGGNPIGMFGEGDAQAFTEGMGLPPLANPMNVEVNSRNQRAPVMIMRATDPDPVWIGADNSLHWMTDDDETYRLDPYEYEPPTEPGGVARGTGVYRLQDGGGWERADPATVPAVVGLWGRGTEGTGEGGSGQPDGDGGDGQDSGPDRRSPSSRPDGTGDPVDGLDGGTGPTSGPVGVSVGGRPVHRPSLEEIREMVFPGGDPLRGDPGSVADLVPTRPPLDGVDGAEFDPNRAARETPPVLPALEQERFPSGPDRELERALWPSGTPGLFPGAAGERERLPGDRTPTAPDTEPTAPTGERVAQPGSTRVGADGGVQTLVSSQVLVGDGRSGTVPGRVDFFRGADGRVEAVTTSPRRVEDDGTEWVWIPNLGTSVSTNPAGRVTSVQSVASPQFPTGTSTQAVRIRTGSHTRPLAGGGAGSEPGRVVYEAVPGDPRLQDVRVEPSRTEVVHADGSSTVTYSALVPANRRWNASGAPERFRVAVGTEMVPATRQVFVPAPAPVLTPAAEPSSEPSFEPSSGDAWTPTPRQGPAPRATGAPSPALVPTPRAVSRPAPATSPAPAPQPEPTWQERAGQVGEVLWNVLTYPHPLSPRGALGPVIWGPAAAEQQMAH